MSRDLRRRLFLIAALAAILALGWATTRHHKQWDLTQAASHSLSPASVETLKQLPGALSLTVYVSAPDAQPELKQAIAEFVGRYQRYKPDLKLAFVDPARQPDQAQQAGVQQDGELVVEYGGRRERLNQLNEQSLTTALLRLAHRKDSLVMYLDGHGERKLDGAANHDLGEFGKRLQQNGFRLAPLNLTLAQEAPENASLLVVTQPRVDWLPGEADKLQRHLARGGNLLWLVDNEAMHGSEALAEQLGLILPDGLVLDPAAEEQRAPATWALASAYPPHAATRDFNLITVFPFARPLLWDESNQDWQHHVLVEAAPRGWVSARPPQAAARFDKARDTPGPAVVALALTRSVADREQRVVVVGSGSFLANTYSGNGGNLDLGVALVNWLANEERLITQPPRAVRDDRLELGKTTLNLLAVSVLVILPLLLAGVGGWLWWRRRRA